MGGWAIGSFVCICGMIGVAFAGCLANFLAFLVFVRPNFRPQVLSLLLACKSMTDLLLLSISTPVFLVQTEFLHGGRYANYVDTLSAVLLIYGRPLSFWLRSAALGLLLLVVAERWLSAFRPQVHSARLTKHAALGAVATVVTVSAAWNAVRFWEYEWTGGREQPRLCASPAYVVGFDTVAYTLTHFLCPVAGLALLSACLCRVPPPEGHELIKREPSTDSAAAHLTLAQVREKRMNATAMFLVGLYGVCALPHFLLVVAEGSRRSEAGGDEGSGLRFWGDLSRVLLLLCSALPPAGYAALNLNFRREAKWYFLMCCLKRADRESEFARSMRNLDRREGGSIRLDDLSRSQRRALRSSVYGKRLSEREEAKHPRNPPDVHITACDTLDEEPPAQAL